MTVLAPKMATEGKLKIVMGNIKCFSSPLIVRPKLKVTQSVLSENKHMYEWTPQKPTTQDRNNTTIL